ncbi:MAG: adenylate/guanylate cyclase domain-containing protein [Planctomycetes bacterium]|nr:adenylate/guanylate cyclase domain-containing protein [Planctomycetota bacterium]
MSEELKKERGILHGMLRAPFRPMSRRGQLIALSIALCCVALVLLVWRGESSKTPFFRFFRLAELSSLNARFLARGPLKPCDDVVIVALDETTLEHLESYPLPRGVYAKLVDRLVEAGAKVIAFDVIFAEPQNKEDLQRLDALIAEWEAKPEPERTAEEKKYIADLKKTRGEIDEDGKLAAALGRALNKGVWVTCAIDLVNTGDETARFKGRKITKQEERFLHNFIYLLKKPKNKEEREELLKVYPPVEAVGVLPVIPKIAEKCAGLAYVDFTPDQDGVLRYETLCTRFNGNYYMPIPIMAAWHFLVPDLDYSKLCIDFSKEVQIADIHIPADARNRMLINYCGRSGTFPTYPLYDVVTGKVPAEKFKGKLVFIGATAMGTGDFIVTPFSARLPGVEKHASVVDNILKQRFLTRGLAAATTDIVAIVVVGLLMGGLLPLLAPVSGLAFTLLLVTGWLGFAHYTFCVYGVWHNMVYPSLTVFLCFGLITLYRFAVEDKQRRRVKHLFERYLDPAVVSDMLEKADHIKLGGDSMAITVLFSDVAGFTRISERLTSAELIDLLNRYFTPLTDIILKHGGFMNKYQGDAIVAAFCVPIESADHAVRACSAAIDCQKRLETLNKEFEAQGLPAMPTRIGLSSGTATVGNIGSAQRLEYTVIGDSINLGQRLEAANKEFRTKIMIGGYTYHAAKERIAVRDLGLIAVVGRDQPVHVYELLDYAGQLSEEQEKLVAVFEKGLALFHERKWDEAVEVFKEALTIAQDDGPSKKFIECCDEFKQNPPPEDWDRSVAMEGK